MDKELEKSNYKFCNETLALKVDIENSFLELGRRLWLIREKEMYRPTYDEFHEFCMELKMSKPTICKLINIYETFIHRFKIPEKKLLNAGGWSVVAEILPFVKTKKQVDYWLNKATVLSRNDLRLTLIEKKTGVKEENCEHDKNYYVLKVCRDCKVRLVIEDFNNGREK